MQMAPHRWATNFREALTLLGRAATRLPFSVDEPVLVGLSALELYSGGAWSNNELELVTDQPRVIHAALMAEGFRWTERPRRAARGLWHPQLQIAAEIVAHALPVGEADPSATLTVELDLTPRECLGPLTFRVIGLEDLITERAAVWAGYGGSRGELAHQLQLLMELGQSGVGGPLRMDYLRRRLAVATAGELEPGSWHQRTMPGPVQARRITETAMLEAIHAWRGRRGMVAPAVRLASRGIGRAWSGRKIHERHGLPEWDGNPDVSAVNVLTFDFPVRPPHR